MAEQSKPTLLRGADGELYFIPEGELDTYRVPDDLANEVTSKLQGIAQQAQEGEEADVAGFSFDQQLSPSSLGLDNPVAPSMDNDKTVVIGSSFEGDGRSFPDSHFLPGDQF